MAKASEIDRIMTCNFVKDNGEKGILTEDTHLGVLNGLMNIMTGTIGNSDAKISQEDVADFISDVPAARLDKYTFELTDLVKTVKFGGYALRSLTNVWTDASVSWHVERGGKRASTRVAAAKLGAS